MQVSNTICKIQSDISTVRDKTHASPIVNSDKSTTSTVRDKTPTLPVVNSPVVNSDKSTTKISQSNSPNNKEEVPSTSGVTVNTTECKLLTTITTVREGASSQINLPKEIRHNVHLNFSSVDEVRKDIEKSIDTLQEKQKEIKACGTQIKYLWNVTKYVSNQKLRKQIADVFMDKNFINLFANLWTSFFETDGENIKLDLFEQHSSHYVWSRFKKLFSTTWNLSDISKEICESVCNSHLLNFIISTLKACLLEESCENERKLYFMKACLGVLHNSVRHSSKICNRIQDLGGVFVLRKCLTVSLDIIKAKALLVLSYIIQEHEQHYLNTDDCIIEYILTILASTIKSSDHFSQKYGMTLMETLMGLNNLAKSDTNKVILVKKDAVNYYTQVLQSDKEDEVILAANGIWSLSFCDENRQALHSHQECLQVLQKLTEVENADICHAARGALWELNNGKNILDVGTEGFDRPHVMISYQWDAQPILLKVKDQLQQAGYKVWMDVEYMTGSTLEAMALAVEKSAVVLICFSERYKNSPNCRTESEYVYRLRKDFIPLKMQNEYQPDGWLGMLLGTRLYFEMHHEDMIDAQLPKVIKELKNRGRIFKHQSSTDSTDSTAGSTIITSVSRQPSDHSPDASSENNVKTFLKKCELCHIEERLSSVDNTLLQELKDIQKRAPEYFYNSLKTDLKLDFTEILRFSRALKLL